jgi:hypothetical protein
VSKTKQARAVTVVRTLNPGPAIVRVEGRGKRVWYLVLECAPDPGPHLASGPARVFSVARLGAASAYTMRTYPAVSCECIGWLAHSKCIHTGMIAALIRERRI